MRISTKALFNLISKSDDKNIKDVLQKIVSDKPELLKTDAPQSSKKTDVKVLVNQLLKELSNNTKTKENVLQLLKQSDMPKLMKTTTSELKILLSLVKNDKSLSKFAPVLEKLLLDVKDIKPEALKQDLAKSGTLMESKLSKTKTKTMPIELKEVLESIKNVLIKQTSKESPHLKLISTLLSSKQIDKSFIETFNSLVKDLKQFPDVKKQISALVEKIDALFSKKTSPNHPLVREVLLEMKSIVKSTVKQDSNLHIKTIENILDAPKADKNFIDDIKKLIINLKQSKGEAKPIVQVVAKLENVLQNSKIVESKIQNTPNNIPKETTKIVEQIKDVLVNIKELITKKESILEPKAQEIIKAVEQTLKMPEFFPKSLEQATVSEKLQQIVNIIKSELVKNDTKNSLHVESSKLANKLEAIIKEHIATKQIVPNQKLQLDIPIKQELANDIKATLLHVKHELLNSSTSTSKEILHHVDRLITQVEYFQLLSLSSNSQATYLPFLWDGLEEGEVSLKKLKENRFFCEINLKLKEYGKIDLMLMLFEDVHLSISVFAEKENFLDLFRENLTLLKQGINKLGLIPSNIQLKKAELKDETYSSNMGLGEGLNLKI